MKVVCFSIVPSPYQRDLFFALSSLVDLEVYYVEPESPDSPWPKKPLAPYESVLPGTYASLRGMRFHFNWRFPNLNGVDVVIINGYMGILFQWLLRLKAKSNKCVFWGERMSNQKPGVKRKIHQWFTSPIQNCVAIAAIGTRALSEYQVRFPSLRVFNVPYYCDLESFQLIPLKTNHKQLSLLFCGQMIFRKGLDVLLDAFELLSHQNDVVLHLIGREADLEVMLSKLSAATKNKIINHGFQPPEKLHEFFKLADIFILPSRYDGWGVVVNQALGAGLPIVCSDQVGAGLDLIDEGKNGFRFRSEDVNDLSDKLRFFLKHPEIIPAMSDYSRKKSFQITPEKGAQQWLEVLQQVK